MATDPPFDVAIVGAGPAGAFAALHLARRQRRVLLIDRASFPRRAACAGWLNARAVPLVEEVGVSIAPLLSRPFSQVTFYNPDLAKSAQPTFAQSPGYLVDRSGFDAALVDAACAAGAEFRGGADVVAVEPHETNVRLALADGSTATARLLILAAGRGTALLSSLGIPRSGMGRPVVTGIVEHDAGASDDKEARVSVVLGLERAGSFAMIVTCAGWASVSIHWLGPQAQARTALIALSRGLCDHGILGMDLTQAAAAAPLTVHPAAFALDMETHVGKNALVVGDAGGFVAAASYEGIYPALWSAQLGAEVVHEALDDKHSQDRLMEFELRWRHAMADYLRAPNTDIHFLLPLIFANQAMADRMGAAFFFGENI